MPVPEHKPVYQTADADEFLVNHIGADLWRTFRTYERAMFVRVAKLGFEDIAVADSDVLVHISTQGTRLSTIAKARGLTKQSVHERVHSLVERGYLEMFDDLDDKRAKVVCYTKKGLKFVRALKSVKQQMQNEIQLLLGPNQLHSLHRMLAKLGDLLI